MAVTASAAPATAAAKAVRVRAGLTRRRSALEKVEKVEGREGGAAPGSPYRRGAAMFSVGPAQPAGPAFLRSSPIYGSERFELVLAFNILSVDGSEPLFAAPGAPLHTSRCRRGRSCRRKSWHTQPGPPRRSGQRQCGRRLRRQAPAKRPPASMAEGRGRADTCCARARWVAELVASKSREAVTGRRRRQRNLLA